MARGLPMKLVSTEVTLDRKRIIFYFTADKRIDFRELVKDLASKFKTRIEMRQIGVRDGARIVGNLGICGRELCCTKFLTTFEPISIKMAKKQELVLNTGKLSGACGRLMCCLGFEYSDTSLDDISMAESDTVSVSEEDMEEAVVASSETPAEPVVQPELSLREDPEQPGSPEKKTETKPKRRKWHPRKRRRKPQTK